MNSSPRVLVSYSHDSEEHKKWVITLVNKLRQDGVDARLADWNIKLGSDLSKNFMDELEKAEHILAICSAKYTKISENSGKELNGESTVLTTELVSTLDNNIIIPIIRNADDTGSLLPTFLDSESALDFRADTNFEKHYSLLLATIIGQKLDPVRFLKEHTYNIVFQESRFYVRQIPSLIGEDAVWNMFPDYQRRSSWNNVQKSKLIESFLLNIPVPPIYLYESEGYSYEVIDGQQRLTAVNDFYLDRFSLTGLESLSPFNGLNYSSCASEIKLILDRSSISANIILYDGGSNGMKHYLDIKRNLFSRLNSGGIQLTNQQLRNAIYPSNFNEILVSLSQYEKFTSAFQIQRASEISGKELSSNLSGRNNLYLSMEDCEIILRFFALREDSDISEVTTRQLDLLMKKHLEIDEISAAKMEDEFKERLDFLCNLFGERPFDIEAEDDHDNELRIQMYEVSMLAIDELWQQKSKIADDAEKVKERLIKTEDGKYFINTLNENSQKDRTYREKVDLFKQILIPRSEHG